MPVNKTAVLDIPKDLAFPQHFATNATQYCTTAFYFYCSFQVASRSSLTNRQLWYPHYFAAKINTMQIAFCACSSQKHSAIVPRAHLCVSENIFSHKFPTQQVERACCKKERERRFALFPLLPYKYTQANRYLYKRILYVYFCAFCEWCSAWSRRASRMRRFSFLASLCLRKKCTRIRRELMQILLCVRCGKVLCAESSSFAHHMARIMQTCTIFLCRII
jgi:hypothetical protein